MHNIYGTLDKLLLRYIYIHVYIGAHRSAHMFILVTSTSRHSHKERKQP